MPERAGRSTARHSKSSRRYRSYAPPRGEDAVFKQELVELRLAWKAKRNFMKLLATFD